MKRLLCISLLLAACNPTPQSDNQSSLDSAAAIADSAANAFAGPKACDLLSADEIQRITRIEVKAGETVTDYMGDSQCRFAVASDSAASVMVTLHRQGRIDPYQKVPGSRAVAGLGDAAVWNPSVFQMAAARGEAVLSIAFLGLPSAKQSWAAPLMRVALQKMEQP